MKPNLLIFLLTIASLTAWSQSPGSRVTPLPSRQSSTPSVPTTQGSPSQSGISVSPRNSSPPSFNASRSRPSGSDSETTLLRNPYVIRKRKAEISGIPVRTTQAVRTQTLRQAFNPFSKEPLEEALPSSLAPGERPKPKSFRSEIDHEPVGFHLISVRW